MSEQQPIQAYFLSKQDRAFLLGVEVRLLKTESYGFLVEDVLDKIHHTILFEQIPALVKARKLRVDRGYYSAPGVQLRAQNKIELPFDLESAKRANIGFQCGLIHAWRTHFNALPGDTLNKAEVAYDAVYPEYRLQQLRLPNPSALAKGEKVPFSTAMSWKRKLDAYEGDARCLIDGRKGNTSFRLHPIVEAFLQKEIEKYLTLSGPIPARLGDSIRTKVEDINEERRAEGRHDLLVVPGHRTIGRRLGLIDKWLVQATRLGPDTADKNHRITMNGLASTRPGERIEIDGWVCKIHTLLKDTDAWMKLDPKIRAQLKVVRITIIVAIDSATRCIVGISFSWSENSDAIAACVRMAMEDKTEIAKDFNCSAPWPMYAWDKFIHDMHPAYDGAEVQAAVLGGLGTKQHSPAGIAWMRGRIERFFKTVASRLISLFLGHTGSKPRERTAHQQQEFASITYKQLVALLIKWVVDEYHTKGHRELGGLSPLQAWYHFSLQAPPAIPLDAYQLLQLFGRTVKLPADGAGILAVGTNYNSLQLQYLLRKTGFKKLTVKVDELDAGQILVRIEDRYLTDKKFEGQAWIEVPALQERKGISYRALEIADQDMAVRFGYDTEVTEKIAREATKSIHNAAREAAQARLTEPPVDLDKLIARMTRTFHPAFQFRDDKFAPKLEALHRTITLTGPNNPAPANIPTTPTTGAVPFNFKD